LLARLLKPWDAWLESDRKLWFQLFDDGSKPAYKNEAAN